MVRKQVPLARALAEAARGQPLLAPAVAHLVGELGHPDAEPSSSWTRLLERVPGLWEEDRVLLSELGGVLGKSDATAQQAELQALDIELHRLVAEARRKEAQDGRLYPALVGALGLMVVILML